MKQRFPFDPKQEKTMIIQKTKTAGKAQIIVGSAISDTFLKAGLFKQLKR